jgi:predicted nucleotidyltransferase
MKKDEVLQLLITALQNEESVVAAYVFGSFVQGNFTANSDLDVGILFRADALPGWREFLDLTVRLSDAVDLEVDIVYLNHASPIVCMQVLRKGKKIFERDAHAVNEYYIRVVNRYDDLKRIRKPIERRVLAGRIFS